MIAYLTLFGWHENKKREIGEGKMVGFSPVWMRVENGWKIKTVHLDPPFCFPPHLQDYNRKFSTTLPNMTTFPPFSAAKKA